MTSAPAGQQASEAAPIVTSAWNPLKNGLFRGLWIATIVSNVGTWMQDVGAGWLMTSLSSSPSMVALVEAADSLPIMLLALPAGAIADIVDRRRLLIAVQFYLMVVAGALGLLTLLERHDAVDAARLHVRARRRRRDGDAGVVGHRPRTGAARGPSVGRSRSTASRSTCRARSDRRSPGVLVAAVGAVARVRAECAVLHRHSSRCSLAGGASTARARCPPSAS